MTGNTLAQDASTPDDTAAIAARVRAAGSSFYWAMRLMDPERRLGLFAIYAFCREVDDIADGKASPGDKIAALANWRGRVGDLCAGRPRPEALDRELARTATAFGLAREDFEAVIAGMEMDARGPIIAPSDAELDLYCDRVACAVGRLCVCVFGAPKAAGRDLAAHLGRALQLTNIIRDVEEDAAMGRLYLPESALRAAGIIERAPEAVAGHPALAEAKAAIGREADAAFTGAKEALARCDRGDMRPAIIMMKVYERLLARMAAQSYACLPRTRLARLREKTEKLWVAGRWAFKGREWRESM